MSFFVILIRPPPSATLFPYTTLFRSRRRRQDLPRRREDAAYPHRGGERHVPLQRRFGRAPDERRDLRPAGAADRKSTRLNSSHSQISYAVLCLKKKKSQSSFPCSTDP